MISRWDLLPQDIIAKIYEYDSTYYDISNIIESINNINTYAMKKYEDAYPFKFHGFSGILFRNPILPDDLTQNILLLSKTINTTSFYMLTWGYARSTHFITSIISNALRNPIDVLKIIENFESDDKFLMVFNDFQYFDIISNLTYVLHNSKLNCMTNDYQSLKIKLNNNYEYNESKTRLYCCSYLSFDKIIQN